MTCRLWGSLFALLMMLLISGCAGEHEDEHLEHHVPPHKPADLISAVDELERRIPLVCGSDVTPSAEDQQELIDIILWIPELAADSDLRKADWEQAAAISQAMQKLLAPSQTPALTQAEGRRVQEQLSPLVTELKELLPRVSVDPHRQPGEPSEPAGATEHTE